MKPKFAIGWRQVFVAFMLMAATAMIASSYSFIVAPIAREFKLTKDRTLLMFAMTVLSGMGAVLTPLLGRLMDRYSIRKLMALGGLLLSAGYALLSQIQSFNQLLLIFGLLIAPANVLLGPVAGTVLISRWFSEYRGRAVGIAIAGVSAGTFIFPRLVQTLLDAMDWRQALLLFSLVLLSWTVPVALLADDRPEDHGLHPDGADGPSEKAKIENAHAPASAWEVIAHPAFWMLALTVAIVTAGMKGMMTNLEAIGRDNGIKATDATGFASIYAVCGFVAKINFALLADKVGPRTLMFAALGGFSLGMALMAQSSGSYWTIAAGIGIIGLFGGLMVPIESYISPRIFGPQMVGRAMGLLSGVILIALLIMPMLFGQISDRTGSYSGIFWACSIAAFAAIFWVPFIKLSPAQQR